MRRKIILAGMLGGIAMFVWSAVVHLATPLGEIGIRELPNELPVLAALQQQLGNAHGLYLFPGPGLGPEATRREKRTAMPQILEKMKTGPSGLLVYHDAGHGISLTPDRLLLEFLTELTEALLAAWLLARTRLVSYAPKVWFVVVVGFVAAITTNLPYYTWYGFPRRYTAAHVLVEIVGYLCAGLVIAGLLQPVREKQTSSF